ncbi:MAG: hypothetical protein K6D02_02065 [Lachnospiraceae bacterium]|nr:hypothetical protein [Lachnospiraceae bacterium]
MIKKLFNKASLKKVFTCFMVSALVVSSPLGQKAASATEEANKKYIKEVVLAYGKTEKEARDWLEKMGYKALDGNINAGTSDDGGIDINVVLVGYKTTSNVSEAIRDMAVMNMSGGYNITDLEKVIKAQNEKLSDDIDHLIELTAAYKTNYKLAVKSKAKGKSQHASTLRIHDLLNKYVDDDTGKGMGDILLKDFTNDNNKTALKALFLQANPDLMGIIENMLVMSVGEGNKNWLQRMGTLNSKKTYFKRILARKRTPRLAKKYIDGLYGDKLDVALDGMKEINERINEAKEITQEINEKYGFEDAAKDKQEEVIKEYFGIDEDKLSDIEEDDSFEESMKKTDDYLDCTENLTNSQKYTETLSIIAYLNGIKYGDETLLDYFTREEGYYENEDNKYELGAIFEAMSDEEISALGVNTNLYTAIKYGMQDDKELWSGKKEIKNAVKQVDNIIKDVDKVSIYDGVKRTMFKESVAITDAGQSRTGDVFNFETSTASNIALIATGAISMVIGSLFIYTGVKFYTLLADSVLLGAEAEFGQGFSFFRNFCANISQKFSEVVSLIINGTTLSSLLDQLSNASKKRFLFDKNYDEVLEKVTRTMRISNVILTVLGVVVAAVGIYFAAKGIWNIIKEKEEYYKGDYSKEIPAVMVDVSYNENSESQYTYYSAVKCNRNSSDFNGIKKTDAGLKDFGDVNGDTGKQWVALYTTTDESYGEPILADSLKVKTGNESLDDGHKQIHSFNEPYVGFNLTSSVYCYSDGNNGTYIDYQVESNDSKADANANAASKDAASAFSKTNLMVIYSVIAGAAGIVLGTGINLLYARKKED